MSHYRNSWWSFPTKTNRWSNQKPLPLASSCNIASSFLGCCHQRMSWDSALVCSRTGIDR
ncbi:hypothetical protein FOXYSP1_04098 [Fusarium oxysporum f. sp. phaseoli]